MDWLVVFCSKFPNKNLGWNCPERKVKQPYGNWVVLDFCLGTLIKTPKKLNSLHWRYLNSITNKKKLYIYSVYFGGFFSFRLQNHVQNSNTQWNQHFHLFLHKFCVMLSISLYIHLKAVICIALKLFTSILFNSKASSPVTPLMSHFH